MALNVQSQEQLSIDDFRVRSVKSIDSISWARNIEDDRKQ